MQPAVNRDYVKAEDYLAGEETSEIKHDYIGGSLYAMSGASTEHNQIALNMAVALRSHLKGKPCRVFVSDVKVRLVFSGEEVFYYPDVMVGCDPRDTHRLYLQYPKLLVEVSSSSTERLDRREKRWAYQTIETLEVYMIVAQDRPEVTIFRKADSWAGETFQRMDQIVVLKVFDLSLPLSLLYEGV